MAQAEVNTIISAIQGALAHQEARRRLELEQQNFESEQERRAAETEQAKAVLKEQHDRTQAELDLQKQAAKLQALNTGSLLSQRAQAGEPIPGDIQTPLPPPGRSTLPPEQQVITHTIPLGPGQEPISFQTVPPEALAARERILNAPKEEAEAKKLKAQNDDQLAKQLQVIAQEHTNRLAEEDKRQTFEKRQKDNEIQAQKARSDSENANRLATSALIASGGYTTKPLSELFGGAEPPKPGASILTDKDGQPQVINHTGLDPILATVEDIADGKVSQSDVNGRLKKMAPSAFALARSRDYSVLSDAQKKKIDDLEQVAQVVPTLQKIAVLRANATSNTFNPISFAESIANPVSAAGKDYAKLVREAGKSLPPIERVLSGTSRQPSEATIKLYTDALIPGTNPLTTTSTTGIDQVKDFVEKDIWDSFNTATSGLSDAQKARIASRINLNRMPYLAPIVNPSGANSLPPPAPGKIRVIRKSDNAPGDLPLNEFDPKLYDRPQ